MITKTLSLAVDMYGCPNRCKHCWLGHMSNRTMEKGADTWLIDYFKSDFPSIAYYSWLREPDFCDNYRERWARDSEISINATPERFELASFWRLVRDPDYVKFLREAGPRRVQLTLFGLEEMTDRYVGRKGAFQEIMQATEILLENQIAPRWQAFINEENKDELPAVLELGRAMELDKRCQAFGETFKFFIHPGSCDGENRKLYPSRIEKEHIPESLIPYFWNYDGLLSEADCCVRLKGSMDREVPHNDKQIILQISNNFDVYFNFTHMTEEWKIGNLKSDPQAEIIRRIVEEDTPALNLARQITLGELAARYGDPASKRAFSLGDYQEYLLNRYVEDQLG